MPRTKHAYVSDQALRASLRVFEKHAEDCEAGSHGWELAMRHALREFLEIEGYGIESGERSAIDPSLIRQRMVGPWHNAEPRRRSTDA